MARIEINNLTKAYGGAVALSNVSLSIEKGQIVGLLGPNGSGKTTLIKLLMGMLVPDFGELTIEGNAPGPETKAITALLPDRPVLPEYYTTDQLLKLYQDFFDDFNMEKAIEMVESLGIVMTQPLKKMSKGTKEKLQLVLTMSREAKVYLLDEPIGGVDPAARDYILKTIISNYNEDALVIISTHLISDIESVLDDVIFINSGEIVLHEKADTIREEKGKGIDELFREVFKC